MSELKNLINTLNNLINKIDSLMQITASDKLAFEKNDTALLQQNNQERAIIQEDLTALIESIFSSSPFLASESFNLSFQQYLQSFDDKTQIVLKDLLEKLNTKLFDYQNLINIHRLVIHSNLKQTKKLLSVLINDKHQVDAQLYNQSGVVETS